MSTINTAHAESTAQIRTDALRTISNGMYVLTACVAETVHAATVTWVTQVSIHPPLLLVALQRNSRLANSVRQAHRFALNILEAGQADIARKFFEHLTGPATATDLAGYGFRASPAHCPLLTDTLGWIECRLAQETPTSGDHTLIIGEVTGSGLRREGRPLVLGDTPWSYGDLQQSQAL